MTRAIADVLVVIPARYGSSRFPGKPLALLWGKPLVQHAWERARRLRGAEVIVATDDLRVLKVAEKFGAQVERTAVGHPSGTDRVAEVARRHPEAAIIVNVQGDEPELDVAAVNDLIAGMREQPGVPMATLGHEETDAAALESEHVVKVGVDDRGYARFFTRQWPTPAGARVLRHIGVYGYRREFLVEFAGWPPSGSEQAERLEQLRAVDRGVPIRVYESTQPSSGVDTQKQLDLLEMRGPGYG
jgi:3-deoxy-manno-octulosonate cytidylyltransferase (CMP-KDO synthetase)